MKKYLTLFLALMNSIVGSEPLLAHDFEAANDQGDIIYYIKRSGTECAVGARSDADDQYSDYYKGDLVIPAQVEYDGHMLKVVEIYHGAFHNCESLTSVTIPETITKITQDAFMDGCPNLTKLYFSSVKALCNMTLWNSAPVEWDKRLYVDGKVIDDLEIPEGVTEIKSSALRYFSLKSIKFPGSLIALHGNVSADRLEYASIEQMFKMKVCFEVFDPNWTETVASYPFGKGYDLYVGGQEVKHLEIPDYVESIPDYLFSGVSNLQSVSFHDGVRSIGNSAFRGCKNLKNLEIPHSVTSISAYAFEGCLGLEGALALPNVATFGYRAFGDCSSLTSVELPSAKGELEWRIFEGCTKLRKVFLGRFITIMHPMFQGCPVEYLKIEATTPPDIWVQYGHQILDSNESGYYSATLEVPAGCKRQYMATNPWNNFQEIVEASESTSMYCDAPSITYEDGKLIFSSSTPDAVYHYSISFSDMSDENVSVEGVVDLSATYYIEAYASAPGYQNSDISSATLCWLGAEPDLNSISVLNDLSPLLIKSHQGLLIIEGAEKHACIEFYAIDGRYLGAEEIIGGSAIFQTSEPIVIVKAGNKVLKIKV